MLSLTVILTVKVPALVPLMNRLGYFPEITAESLTDRGETTDGVSVGSGSIRAGNLKARVFPKSRVRSVRGGENMGGPVFGVDVTWNCCGGTV